MSDPLDILFPGLPEQGTRGVVCGPYSEDMKNLALNNIAAGQLMLFESEHDLKSFTALAYIDKVHKVDAHGAVCLMRPVIFSTNVSGRPFQFQINRRTLHFCSAGNLFCTGSGRVQAECYHVRRYYHISSRALLGTSQLIQDGLYNFGLRFDIPPDGNFSATRPVEYMSHVGGDNSPRKDIRDLQRSLVFLDPKEDSSDEGSSPPPVASGFAARPPLAPPRHDPTPVGPAPVFQLSTPPPEVDLAAFQQFLRFQELAEGGRGVSGTALPPITTPPGDILLGVVGSDEVNGRDHRPNKKKDNKKKKKKSKKKKKKKHSKDRGDNSDSDFASDSSLSSQSSVSSVDSQVSLVKFSSYPKFRRPHSHLYSKSMDAVLVPAGFLWKSSLGTALDSFQKKFDFSQEFPAAFAAVWLRDLSVSQGKPIRTIEDIFSVRLCPIYLRDYRSGVPAALKDARDSKEGVFLLKTIDELLSIRTKSPTKKFPEDMAASLDMLLDVTIGRFKSLHMVAFSSGDRKNLWEKGLEKHELTTPSIELV